MPISRSRQFRVALALAALAVGTAACGGSSSNASKGGSTAPSSGPATSAPANSTDPGGYGGYGSSGGGAGTASSTPSAAKVAVAKSGGLGQFLVDGAGRSLYLFEKDKGSTSNCSGDCAKVWPPFTSSGPATAGAGAMSSLLGTTSRTDGSKQVTYHGHPLYYYVSDGSKAGSTAGQGLNQFGAGWYVLSPAGSKVDKGGS